jgi:DhnA family fructose-bisphosphate aldolase class Ia
LIFQHLNFKFPKEQSMPMTGETVRLRRLFADGKNAVVVAIDHGLYMGPLPGMQDLASAVRRLGGADAILLTAGMVEPCHEVFANRGAPAMLLRLNWATNYVTVWNYEHSHSVAMTSVADAVSLGADLVLASLTLQNPNELEDAGNVEIFSQYVAEKRSLGIPLIGEVFPTGGDDARPEDLQERVLVGCRMIAELGADVIKTFYTGDGFREVVDSTPIPILALGAPKKPREIDALKLAASAIDSGARGVVFGRNVVQAREPDRFLDALKAVVKEHGAPDQVAANFGLS